MKPLLVVVTLACASLAPAQNLRIVNAASLSAGSVAPGSIVTIFGTKLTAGVAIATDVQKPPVTLGGVGVSIGGVGAALFYVSPTQINLVVDPKTPSGMEAVVVTSGSGTQTGTVQIDTNAPPGLFSLFGSGARDGAILNAVTFLLGDFSTHTANSPTYLALFATGLNLSVTPVVTIGGVQAPVVFSGAAPCCDGLDQINVMLPDSLSGAGRVPIVLMENTISSNTVQVVLLPPPGTEFPGDQDNQTRSREIAGIAWIPGSSLVLVADQNDDVVRVVDVHAKQVTQVIPLADGSHPTSIAVTADGATAVVTESGRAKAAILNLTKFSVTTEVPTDLGPIRVAIKGTQAVVLNQDQGTITIINLSNNTVQKTLAVGHGPDGIAIDPAVNRAFVLNEDDGTVSVIDLAAPTVMGTIPLGASLRPESIAVTGTGFAFITLPAAGPSGSVILLNLGTYAQTIISANPDRSGGSNDVVFFNNKLYLANQTGGSVSVIPFLNGAAGAASTIKVDLGPRALAIDAKDNLLVVSNEGSGTLVLVDLGTNSLVGRISAVRESDGEGDDHGDHDHAMLLPAVQSVTPALGKTGVTVSITVSGSNLTGASSVVFDLENPSGKGDNGNDKNKTDTAVVAGNITVNSSGTALTVSVQIGSGAQLGPHVVRVVTPAGESSGQAATGNVFTVM